MASYVSSSYKHVMIWPGLKGNAVEHLRGAGIALPCNGLIITGLIAGYILRLVPNSKDICIAAPRFSSTISHYILVFKDM